MKFADGVETNDNGISLGHTTFFNVQAVISVAK